MVPGCSCSQEQLSQEQLAKRNFNQHLQARLEARTESPSKVPKDRFLNKVPKQSYENQVPEQGPNEQVWSKQAKFPRTGSQERVPKNRLPGNAPKSGFLRIGSQEQVPKQGSEVSSNVSKNSCPGKVPRTLNNRIRRTAKVWRLVLITEWRDWRRTSFASKHDTALAHG